MGQPVLDIKYPPISGLCSISWTPSLLTVSTTCSFFSAQTATFSTFNFLMFSEVQKQDFGPNSYQYNGSRASWRFQMFSSRFGHSGPLPKLKKNCYKKHLFLHVLRVLSTTHKIGGIIDLTYLCSYLAIFRELRVLLYKACSNDVLKQSPGYVTGWYLEELSPTIL